MHYVRPFTIMELDKLRHQAVNIVAARLGRAEPPLRKEVVEYMSDVDSHPLEHAEEQGEFLPINEGIWNFRYRARYPPHMNIKISQAEGAHPDELDEEFDTFPTSKSPRSGKDEAVAGLAGLYAMRHPRFRYRLPSVRSTFSGGCPLGLTVCCNQTQRIDSGLHVVPVSVFLFVALETSS
ncbi:hypothetical protein Vadar_004742 [Vaccinium darrowii]|uniref:Uncharacterized protein n=1 Tax=Vaccinium darrowii TaxID=229202 RepID=A0ACB7ZAE6_9ERIC|nr:hypothetical protein Vadar_004742 [Vaccinium darrowii]